MSAFLKWWLLITLTVVGLSIAAYFNFIQFLYAHDLTKLSVAILALFAATTSVIGYKIWKERDVKKKKYGYDVEWFVSEMMISLGMIGTVIGFIIMLGSLSDITTFDVSLLQGVLTTMGSGMGVALYTTLSALVTGVLIALQYFNLENGCEELFSVLNQVSEVSLDNSL